MTKSVEIPGVGVAEFPDDMSNDDIARVISQQYGNGQATEGGQQERSTADKVGRGVAAGARDLLETPGLTIAGLSDLLARAINFGLEARGAPPGTYRLPTNRAETVQEGFDRMGFPQPETRGEEIRRDVGRAVVSAGFGPAAGRSMSGSASPVTRGVGNVLQESTGVQAAGATTASLAGNVAEDAGAGPGGILAAELMGGAFGPAGAAATSRTVSGGARVAAGVKDSLTKSGQRKIAGNVLDDRAVNPSRAAQNLDDAEAFGAGVSDQTTGALSRDQGLLTLERSLRNTDTTGRFASQVSAGNEARQRILDVIGGGDLDAARSARDATTGAQRRAAFKGAANVDDAPILAKIDSIAGSPAGKRKTVRRALSDFRKEIEGVKNPAELYEVRKDINLAIQGKLRDPERSDFGLAKKQLGRVKEAIDDEIEKAAPGFKRYLSDYARLSKDIDRREIIQRIQKQSTVAVPDASTGREVLSQAKFRRQLIGAKEKGQLSEDQLTVLQTIADDLDLGMSINSAGIRPTGSDTAKNLTVAHIIGRAIGRQADHPFIDRLTGPLRWITKLSEQDVLELLTDAMLDPRLARALLAEARPREVHRASKSLRDIAGASAAGAAAESASNPR